MPNQYTKDPRTVERVCNNCGIIFLIERARLARKAGRFCTKSCYDQHRGAGLGPADRRPESCRCGKPRQRRAPQCRSCAAKASYKYGYASRVTPHDFTAIVVPRQPESPIDLGSYITGLWDGEGCFVASASHRSTGRGYLHAGVSLAMRADDAALVELVASYFGVGSVRARQAYRTADRPNNNPQVTWTCGHARKLMQHVIPHFDRYPPRGKKRPEYELWRQIVCEVAAWAPSMVKVPECFPRVAALVTELQAMRVYKDHAQAQ